MSDLTNVSFGAAVDALSAKYRESGMPCIQADIKALRDVLQFVETMESNLNSILDAIKGFSLDS